MQDAVPRPAQNAAQADKRTLHVLYGRTSDGSYNDLSVPTMGMAGTRFGRNVPVQYAYPDSGPALMTPSPRTARQSSPSSHASAPMAPVAFRTSFFSAASSSIFLQCLP